jgi:hypothetical protein
LVTLRLVVETLTFRFYMSFVSTEELLL